MKERLLENDYWIVDVYPRERLLRVTRTAKPLPLDHTDLDLDSLARQLAARPHKCTALLIDMRAPPLRNDPAFEASNRARGAILQGFLEQFERRAMLLSTAVGRLQVTRFARERTGSGLATFLDETEALAYLARAS